jgi:outer membrane immunogenic protein
VPASFASRSASNRSVFARVDARDEKEAIQRGVGIEFAFAPNWSAKVEALYFDLGTDRYTVDNALVVDAGHSGLVVRGGINYRFNWGGLVMARY